MFYLDHEEQVKFVDGVLAHSQEWQWLIDIIGEKAEFKDMRKQSVFCKYKLPKNAEALPKSYSRKFLKVA